MFVEMISFFIKYSLLISKHVSVEYSAKLSIPINGRYSNVNDEISSLFNWHLVFKFF